MLMVALAVILMLGYILLSGGESQTVAASAPSPTKAAQAKKKTPNHSNTNTSSASDDPNQIAAPYEHYILTQGPHGAAYGQMAIDIYAGKGSIIHSPINGTISENFVDNVGNTTIMIENSRYRVLLLHGNYTVKVGQKLAIGDPVGTESNNGNTVDFQGRSCRGRDCGYHTHLNIFDKKLGSNVNPLDLISSH
jgi:biotin carboxyl carrier protein